MGASRQLQLALLRKQGTLVEPPGSGRDRHEPQLVAFSVALVVAHLAQDYLGLPGDVPRVGLEELVLGPKRPGHWSSITFS